MVCQQTSPKYWFANVNTTSYRDVTNSVYPVTMTTIRHCSILEFGRGNTINRDPTFGEFVPKLGISATFGEKFGELRYLGIFRESAFCGIKLGTVSVVTHFHQIS